MAPYAIPRLREILLLFAVSSGSRWPYRASASRFLLQRAFRRRPWRLTRAIVFVGNIPDCAQRQKPIQNHTFGVLIFSFDFKSTFEPPSEE
ncbi:TPA: hypothetical protein ACPZMC_000539 [Yersinia enterocolitica]|uniref:hypothetical protein n=1 Tax=Yersinia TaxID=629 RepID=UPI000B28DA92|nr:MULTISPECIES: hypothetical protein [Yersinia]EKN3485898.1 hypothetical protein [Yersinia enterocolitica]EKN3567828.1 hypothetical protein [Yersinia enterocolitica]EKN3681794.1 hypothetical protein [Yersinia enterocolitica]EKN3978359.1 hypothetical protein [Yersinia enterocolitica]EKN3983893.1 hypothetical protein [Yersinia enterocolitica]